MLLTPTYHVFNMYKAHQDAILLDSFISSSSISEFSVPNLHESTSVSDNGDINISICNLSHNESYEIDTKLIGGSASKITGKILTGAIDSYNTFSDTNVLEQTFNDFVKMDKGFSFRIPPVSVMMIRVVND